MQIFCLFICTQSAVHVSGDVFANHREHLTVFTASYIVHLCCCRPVSWTRWNEMVQDTGQQQHRCTISQAVNTIKCSWWWAKTSSETCRADWVQINKPKSCILLVINYEATTDVWSWMRFHFTINHFIMKSYNVVYTFQLYRINRAKLRRDIFSEESVGFELLQLI